MTAQSFARSQGSLTPDVSLVVPSPGVVEIPAARTGQEDVGSSLADDTHVRAIEESGAPPERLTRLTRLAGRAVVHAALSQARMPGVLVAVDAAAMAIALGLARPTPVWSAVLAVVALALYAHGRLYRSRLSPSVLDQLPSIAGRALVAGALVAAVAPTTQGGLRGEVIRASLAFAALVCIGRASTYAAIARLRRAGVVAHRTLILGGGQVSRHVAEVLLAHPEYGLRPQGFVDDDPLLARDEQPVPHLGRNVELAAVIRERRINTVVVAFGSSSESTLVDVLRACDRLACEIFFVPRLYELQAVSDDMEVVWGIPLVRWQRAAFRTVRWRAKRAMDVVLASLSLVLLSPILLACAVSVRLDTGRGVIFRQERVGLDGHVFTMLKFRSLRPATEAESSQLWTLAEDQRVGRVGRILRRTSLDELPQLWNVLRGDMSLVGPRPERPFFVAEFAQRFPRYMARQRVPAGLTGCSQVYGLRGDTSISDRARFDNWYIENWSVWGDVKIMLRTVGQVVHGSGS